MGVELYVRVRSKRK